MVTAKTAPTAVTNMIPASFSPNHSMASGTHATDGIDCNPKTRDPTVWLTASTSSHEYSQNNAADNRNSKPHRKPPHASSNSVKQAAVVCAVRKILGYLIRGWKDVLRPYAGHCNDLPYHDDSASVESHPVGYKVPGHPDHLPYSLTFGRCSVRASCRSCWAGASRVARGCNNPPRLPSPANYVPSSPGCASS